MIHKEDMGRQWFLDVAACGAVQIRERGLPMREGLPVFSTDTREQAESIRTLHCRLERDGSGTYRLNERPADVDDLERVSDLFRNAYDHLK
jgi:hypothetical protein